MSATIDGARKMTWDQAQDEINFVHEKVKATIGIEEPTIKNLWDLIFGPESDIGLTSHFGTVWQERGAMNLAMVFLSVA